MLLPEKHSSMPEPSGTRLVKGNKVSVAQAVCVASTSSPSLNAPVARRYRMARATRMLRPGPVSVSTGAAMTCRLTAGRTIRRL